MKILFVNDYTSPLGGAEMQISSLKREMTKRGHCVGFFGSRAGQIPGMNRSDWDCFGTRSRFQVVLETANPWAFFGLRRALRQFRPDLVHLSMFRWQLSPLILPLLHRIPVVYHIVNYKPVCPLGHRMLPDGSMCVKKYGMACLSSGCLSFRAWPFLMSEMKLWEHWKTAIDMAVANSRFQADLLARHGFLVSHVVHGGVPTVPKPSVFDRTPTVVFAGRLVPEKGAHVLIKAMEKVVRLVPGARLVLVGEGPEAAALKSLSQELRLTQSVIMPGALDRTDMEKRFAGAWVQAIPSLWPEPFGMAAVDAMVRGTPVVASRIGGLTETVEHGTSGFLVQPGRSEPMADALVELLRNRRKAEAFGQRGHRRALAEFSESNMADRFENIYRILLDGRNAHGSAKP